MFSVERKKICIFLTLTTGVTMCVHHTYSGNTIVGYANGIFVLIQV